MDLEGEPLTEGDYLVTINATDPYLGWGVIRTVKSKAFVHMKAGHGSHPGRLPDPDPRSRLSTTAAIS